MSATAPIVTLEARRLVKAFAASLLIHSGLIVGLNVDSMPVSGRTEISVNPLKVSLPNKPGRMPERKSDKSMAREVPSQPVAKKAGENTLSPARFLSNPDLDALQNIPVMIGGSVKFRLHVSEIGTVGMIEVLQSTPTSVELLEGLKANLKKATLYPAQSDGKAIPSTLDITVRYEALEVLSR